VEGKELTVPASNNPARSKVSVLCHLVDLNHIQSKLLASVVAESGRCDTDS